MSSRIHSSLPLTQLALHISSISRIGALTDWKDLQSCGGITVAGADLLLV